jgi:hypothetical protein
VPVVSSIVTTPAFTRWGISLTIIYNSGVTVVPDYFLRTGFSNPAYPFISPERYLPIGRKTEI